MVVGQHSTGGREIILLVVLFWESIGFSKEKELGFSVNVRSSLIQFFEHVIACVTAIDGFLGESVLVQILSNKSGSASKI